MAHSLATLLRDYLLRKITAVQSSGSLYLLVLDEVVEKALFKVLSKDKLLRHIASVDRIDAKRRSSAHIEAIYLVEASVYNLKCILGDANTRRYKAGHLLLISCCDTAGMTFYDSSRFMGDPAIARFLNEGRNVIPETIPLTIADSRVFIAPSLTPIPLHVYHNDACQHLVHHQVSLAARSLVAAMVLTGEYPYVRYLALPEASHDSRTLPELVANAFQTQIDEYARVNVEYPPPSTAARLVLVITDRTIDTFAPLLHDFTYQAMAMDVVPSLATTGKYKYSVDTEAGDSKEMECEIDNEDDDYWVKLRYRHIVDASTELDAVVKEFVKNNSLLVDRLKATTSSDLMHIVAHLKGFDDERRRLLLHRSLVDTCLAINAKTRIAEVATDFEQPCAAKGIGGDGDRVRDLHEKLISLLASSELDASDKLRLVFIYAFYRDGLVQLDIVKLTKFIATMHPDAAPAIATTLANSHKAGVHVSRPSFKSNSPQTRFHTCDELGAFSTLRFVPALANILEQAATGALSDTWFPYFRDQPLKTEGGAGGGGHSLTSSLPSHTGLLRNTRVKASWALSLGATGGRSSTSGPTRPRQRIFCYVAGGVTYGEVRCVHELASSGQREFYLGSEAILGPGDFLMGLQGLDPACSPEELGARPPSRTDKPPAHVFDDGRPKAVPVQAAPEAMAVPLMQQVSPPREKEKEKKKSKLRGLFK